MFKDLTPSGKIVVPLIILAIIAGGIYFGMTKFVKKDTIADIEKKQIEEKFNVSDEADIVVAYNTFIGCAGLLYMNNGKDVNMSSRLFKEYGLKVQIKQIDVVQDTRDGLKNDILDVAYCTVDALSIETGSNSFIADAGVKVYMKVNESRGADVIVVNNTIKSVKDLKGKKVAYAVGTASNTLLLNVLETANMSLSDIVEYKVADGVEASDAFQNGKVDAALVWAPDDEICVRAVKGSKVLVSTATATQIIADGILVKSQNYEAKKEKINKLIKAWLVGNAEINDNPLVKKKAAQVFAKAFSFPEDIAIASIDKVRFSTLGDNKRFFGLDPTYTGVTGEKMYGRMSVKYTEARLAKAPVSWRLVSDPSAIEYISTDNEFSTSRNQEAEGNIVFKPATPAEIKKEASSSKVVTLTFHTNSFELDEQDKIIIDREVSSLAQGFAGARIRVEGNTDNVGNAAFNKQLSYKRAKAVVDYLVREYKFDPNKFIIVGNGQEKPICNDDSEQCREMNRRTDFQFIF